MPDTHGDLGPPARSGLIWAVEIRCPQEQLDRLIAELYELGTLGIIESEQRLTAYFGADTPRETLTERLAAFKPRFSLAPDADWSVRWRELWKAREVGERFYLAPEWSDEPTPPGRIRLRMRPGMACGTGLHPCTQLCLELMERHLRPGAAVVDVGTGSGLLAVAAARLGARCVLACDIDEKAVSEAQWRFRQEGLQQVLLFQGSLRALRSLAVDLALVNISAAALMELAGELARVIKPAGACVASGFRKRLSDCVRAALQQAGFRPTEERDKDGWAALVCYTPSYAQTEFPGSPKRRSSAEGAGMEPGAP